MLQTLSVVLFCFLLQSFNDRLAKGGLLSDTPLHLFQTFLLLLYVIFKLSDEIIGLFHSSTILQDLKLVFKLLFHVLGIFLALSKDGEGALLYFSLEKLVTNGDRFRTISQDAPRCLTIRLLGQGLRPLRSQHRLVMGPVGAWRWLPTTFIVGLFRLLFLATTFVLELT